MSRGAEGAGAATVKVFWAGAIAYLVLAFVFFAYDMLAFTVAFGVSGVMLVVFLRSKW